MGVDPGHGYNAVEHGREGGDDVSSLAFQSHMGGAYFRMGGFDFQQLGCGLVDGGASIAFVFDIKENEPFVKHSG